MFNSLVNDSEPRKFVVKGPLNMGWILFGRWQTLLYLEMAFHKGVPQFILQFSHTCLLINW